MTKADTDAVLSGFPHIYQLGSGETRLFQPDSDASGMLNASRPHVVFLVCLCTHFAERITW